MTRLAGAIAAVVVAVVVGAALLLWPTGPQHPTTGPQRPAVATPDPVTPFPTLAGSTLAALPVARHQPACQRHVAPFAPASIAIAGVTSGAPVLALPRDAAGVPGVPPLTSTGKTEFAWDRPPGIRPGARHGNVLLNAHTWPDGTALGNHLLAGLHEGDRIVVRGGHGERLCYRVTDRVELPADAAGRRYYRTTGRPQLAIVVCSGTRLGPGDWTERTLWFASPTPR